MIIKWRAQNLIGRGGGGIYDERWRFSFHFLFQCLDLVHVYDTHWTTVVRTPDNGWPHHPVKNGLLQKIPFCPERTIRVQYVTYTFGKSVGLKWRTYVPIKIFKFGHSGKNGNRQALEFSSIILIIRGPYNSYGIPLSVYFWWAPHRTLLGRLTLCRYLKVTLLKNYILSLP